MLLCLLFLASAAGMQDIIVFLKLGKIAEHIGVIAVDLGPAQLTIVLRLIIHNTLYNGHPCLTNNLMRHCFIKTNHLVFT